MNDRDFLTWISNRLVNRYGESEHTDFVQRLKRIAEDCSGKRTLLDSADVLNILTDMTDGLLWKQPEVDGNISRFTQRLNDLLSGR